MTALPLQGLVVLEFCQYLSGPSAGLRLADLGARVIKIEQPGTGDAGRKLSIKDLWVGNNSLLFHTVNRNKESFAANLKNSNDLETIKKIIAKADVLIHNFRPGVMKKFGLDYTMTQQINPNLIYAGISGYGKEGPWKDKPGQDLLLQSMTGLAYTTGNGNNGPVPFGIAIADILCGAQLVQGILAALIRRQKKAMGALIEISLMESLLDFQFELLTTYFTSNKQPQRSYINNGHPLLSAPYGIYATTDGHLALAMMDIEALAKATDCEALCRFTSSQAFTARDEIKDILVRHIATQATSYWLNRLQQQGLWAMEVFDWEKMMQHEAYKKLQMEQIINTGDKEMITTRCPIRINGRKLFSSRPAPQVGEHNEKIYTDFISAQA
jgi:crotonobetainyl-CoA:carnitine CoA-transferase CaiB-like acyl-CoA transferase